MAAPLAKFKTAIFDSPLALQAYVVAGSSDVNSIVAIVADNNGKWVLFYMTP